jgi:sulfatase maturation enzyme AslB (radical SAM superfamily)
MTDKNTNLKTRIFPESNYKAVFCNGKTIRIAIDPSKPITELEYPEFYDVKITNKCDGNCPYCYQNSQSEDDPYLNIIDKFKDFFSKFDENQKPFQIAFGGGEPTSHPDFAELMKTCYDMGIMPNYTTNGMNVDQELIEVTKKYCGGVAISCHPHLEKYWQTAIEKFNENDVMINLHIIISDKKSICDFFDIYDEYKNKVDYFVLLPYSASGRAKKKYLDFDCLFKILSKIEDKSDIAFGANFYEHLKKWNADFDVSLYEPEIMSKYLDLKDMKLYKSSFSTQDK